MAKNNKGEETQTKGLLKAKAAISSQKVNLSGQMSNVPMAKLHSLLACTFIMSTYNNLLLKAKGRKKLVKLQYVIIYYGEMKSKASFHHSRSLHTEI